MRTLWMVLKNRDCRLQTLNLCDNELGDGGGQNLARVLEKYPRYLRHLDLRLNGLGDAAAARICTALLPTPDDVEWPEWKPPKPLAHLLSLNLAANSLSNGCVDEIIELIRRSQTLQRLDISCNRFVVDAAQEESMWSRSSGPSGAGDYATALSQAALAKPKTSGGLSGSGDGGGDADDDSYDLDTYDPEVSTAFFHSGGTNQFRPFLFLIFHTYDN